MYTYKGLSHNEQTNKAMVRSLSKIYIEHQKGERMRHDLCNIRIGVCLEATELELEDK